MTCSVALRRSPTLPAASSLASSRLPGSREEEGVTVGVTGSSSTENELPRLLPASVTFSILLVLVLVLGVWCRSWCWC